MEYDKSLSVCLFVFFGGGKGGGRLVFFGGGRGEGGLAFFGGGGGGPTSCLCPINLLSTALGVLASRCRISLSLLPDESTSPFHARAPKIWYNI